MEDLIITDEEVRKLLDKASQITMTDYQDYSIQSLICAVDDLIAECGYLKDDIVELVHDRDDNYRPITRAEEICFNEKDFI